MENVQPITDASLPSKQPKARPKPVDSIDSVISCKVRIYPTDTQKLVMKSWFGASRWTYNAGLAWWNQEYDQWKLLWLDSDGKKKKGAPAKPSKNTFSKLLTRWKSDKPEVFTPFFRKNREGVMEEFDVSWLRAIPRNILEQSLIDLEGAFSRFFDEISDRPRFKPRPVYATDDIDMPGACRVQLFDYPGWKKAWRENRLEVPGLEGSLILVDEKLLPEHYPASIALSCNPSGQWFASMTCRVMEKDPVETSLWKAGRQAWADKARSKNKRRPQTRDNKVVPMPEVYTMVGVDQNMGDNSRLVMSDGKRVGRDRYLARYQRHLEIRQNRLSKKTKGSNRYHHCRKKVARCHQKVANRREDFLQKQSLELVRGASLVALEDLFLAGMLEKMSPAARRSLLDAGFGRFAELVEQKCLRYGRKIIRCGRFDATSKTCSTDNCGYVHPNLALGCREWTCPKCNITHDRDINAAKNILRFALQREAEAEQTAQMHLLHPQTPAAAKAAGMVNQTPLPAKAKKAGRVGPLQNRMLKQEAAVSGACESSTLKRSP
jgi:putative transposase